jgi:hypothetical protein
MLSWLLLRFEYYSVSSEAPAHNFSSWPWLQPAQDPYKTVLSIPLL